MKHFKLKQWFILLIYSVVNFLSSCNLSIRGPLYPIIAEEKGVKPSVYGVVIGILGLSIFVSSPLIGKIIPIYGSTFICNVALFLSAAACILFGFLDMINDVNEFIGLSIAIRIVEGIFYAAFRCASLSIITNEFTDDIEYAFAVSQSFMTVGLVVGPAVGGALFEVGGFVLPHLVIGIFLWCLFIVLVCIPKGFYKEECKLEKYNLKYYDLLRIPMVSFSLLVIFGAFLNIGFILAFLEPHTKSLSLTPTEIGLLYICNSLAYAFSSNVWGLLCKSYLSPHYVWIIGSVLTIVGIILLGPAPYGPFQLNIYTCIFSLLIHGLGESAESIAAFSGMNKNIAASGISMNMTTNSLISSLFTMSLSLALFIGQSFGGILVDSIGFPWSSHVFALYHLILALATIICVKYFSNKKPEERLMKDYETFSYNSTN